MHDSSDAAVRKLAHDILARPEYAHAANPKLVLLAWLRRLFEWSARFDLLRVSVPALYWTIIAVFAIVLFALIAHIIWALRMALRAPRPVSRAIASESAPDLAAEAEALAATGRYLEAAHRLMIASFRALAEQSVIELRPDRSNRWIRGALRGSSLAENLAIEIDGLVERTERRWFGDRANDPDIYLQWRSTFARLSAAGR
ncbi:MAG: hypothetical protein ACREQN_12200 [Candidatus Binataceae bacterium]